MPLLHENLDFLCRALPGAFLLLLGLLVPGGARGRLLKGLAAGLAASLTAYLFSHRLLAGQDSTFVFTAVVITIPLPFLMWMLTATLLDDEFVVTKKLAAALAAVIGSQLVCFVLFRKGPSEIGWPAWLLTIAVPWATTCALAYLTVRAAVDEWRDDLVESRRQLRGAILAAAGSLVLLAASGEVVAAFFGPTMRDDATLVVALGANVVVATIGRYFLEVRADLLPLPKAVPVVVRDEDEHTAEKLKDLMEAGAYREEGLTIGELARRVGVPEYRLRKVINVRLGFRNFNRFLAEYRVEDACRRLAGNEGGEKKVLEIALDVGYQSLAPFNRAFKEITGVTPSEYRKAKSA